MRYVCGPEDAAMNHQLFLTTESLAPVVSALLCGRSADVMNARPVSGSFLR
jgi:hypothetical protein